MFCLLDQPREGFIWTFRQVTVSFFKMRWSSLLFFTLISPLANAFDWHVQNDLSEKYSHRVFNNSNATETAETDDHLVRDILNLNVTHENFYFEVRPEIRSVWSWGLELSEDDPAFLSAHSPKRLFQLENSLHKETDWEVVSDIERVYFSYQAPHGEINIGRLPLGIGVMKALPMWNKFSPALINTQGSDIIYNPDLAQGKVQFGEVSIGLIDIESTLASDKIQLGQMIWYSSFVELQVLGGHWWERNVGGLAFVKDISGFSVKGESLFINSTEDLPPESQFGFGVEYAFNAKLSFLTETLHDSQGAENSDEYTTHPHSRFNPLLASDYWYLQLDYIFTDFLKGNIGSLINMIDGSSLATFELTDSLTNEIDVGFQARVPLGGSSQEFGRVTLDPQLGVYNGYPQKYSLTARWVF